MIFLAVGCDLKHRVTLVAWVERAFGSSATPRAALHFEIEEHDEPKARSEGQAESGGGW